MGFDQAVLLLITFITGVIGVPITQAVKNLLGIEDGLARTLAGIVSLVLGVVSVGLSGQFGWSDFLVFENIPVIAPLVWGFATLVYGYLKNGTEGVQGALAKLLRVGGESGGPVG